MSVKDRIIKGVWVLVPPSAMFPYVITL